METYGYSLEEVAKVFGDDAHSPLISLDTGNGKTSIEHLEQISSVEVGKSVWVDFSILSNAKRIRSNVLEIAEMLYIICSSYSDMADE